VAKQTVIKEMNMLKQILSGGSMCALLLTGSLSAQAQTQTPPSRPQPQQAPQVQVPPAELQKFAKTIKQLQAMQQQAQTAIVQVVQREGLSEARFVQIYQAQQNPQAQPKPAVTSQEKQKFAKAFTQAGQIQQQTQSKMQQVVQQQGLEVQRFNQILTVVKQDPTLRQKVLQLMNTPS